MKQSVLQSIEQFYECYPKRHYTKKQIIIYGDELPSAIYFLSEGLIRQYDITKDGKEIVVNIFKPPAILPASLAINHSPNSYFFDAMTEITIQAAPIKEFEKFLKNNHEVTYDLLQRVYKGVEGLQRRSAYIMSGDTEARLLYELVYECDRFGKKQQDGCILNTSETEIATRVGISRETISRYIQSYSHNKMIEVKHKKIIIKNLKVLKAQLHDSVF